MHLIPLLSKFCLTFVKLREQKRIEAEKREQEAELERKKQATREVAERNEQRAAQAEAQGNDARRLKMRQCVPHLSYINYRGNLIAIHTVSKYCFLFAYVYSFVLEVLEDGILFDRTIINMYHLIECVALIVILQEKRGFSSTT